MAVTPGSGHDSLSQWNHSRTGIMQWNMEWRASAAILQPEIFKLPCPSVTADDIAARHFQATMSDKT